MEPKEYERMWNTRQFAILTKIYTNIAKLHVNEMLV